MLIRTLITDRSSQLFHLLTSYECISVTSSKTKEDMEIFMSNRMENALKDEIFDNLRGEVSARINKEANGM